MNTIDHEDVAFHEHLRATLRAVSKTTPIDHIDVNSSVPRRRRPLAMWAAAAAFILVAGAGLWMRMGSEPSPAIPAAPTVEPEATLVPTKLSAGHVLYTGSRQGVIGTDSGAPYIPWADRVYAPEAGFDSPRQLIGVTVTPAGLCAATGAETLDVDGHTASLCSDFYDTTGLSWPDGGNAVNVVAGGLTTLAQLVDFADALSKLGGIADSSNVPDGWTLLGDNHAAINAPDAQQVHYIVGPSSGANGLQYIATRIWSHVPGSALYAIGYPLTGESVTVRGVPAILDAKEPNNVFLFWVDPTGSVVSVQAYGGDRQSALDFANSLQPTDQAGFESFVVTAAAPPFALPRDARGDDIDSPVITIGD